MSIPTEPTNVAVVGCGNIGSRLLQSLARVNGVSLSVDGFDRSEAAREIALQRFDDVREGRANTLGFPEGPADSYALGVIATDSRNRLEALRNLVRRESPKRMVLEKFLFTRAEEYEAAAKLLTENRIEAWVNCSRNEWPGYAKLTAHLAADSIRSVRVIGADWGLACNAIHYLALLEYLTDSKIEDMGWIGGQPKVREARRPGYLELTGSLVGRTESDATFTLTSLASGGGQPEVTIKTTTGRYTIKEGDGMMLIETGGVVVEQPFEVALASQLAPVFERILIEGRSALPSFADSAELHLKAMAVMNEGFYGNRRLDAECPVT